MVWGAAKICETIQRIVNLLDDLSQVRTTRTKMVIP